MKKKLTALLSLLLTVALTIPVFAGTEPMTIAMADTHGRAACTVAIRESVESGIRSK